MNDKERHQLAFQRPKSWMKQKVYSATRKQKCFGLTTSNGKILAFNIPWKWTAERWRDRVHAKVAPFLKRAFPGRTSFTILLDGEKVFHAPVAKAAMAMHGIKALPGWPASSPEFNTQESVWPVAESNLRDLEKSSDTFEDFQVKVEKAVRSYPSPEKIVPGIAKRIRLGYDAKGGPIRK